MRAFRLVKKRFAGAAFDGEGARLYGGRWNSSGIAMAYASESIALATLEVLVHLQSTSVLSSYSLATARFPGTLIEEIDASSLPPRWRSYPSPPELQAIGDRWAQEQRSAILRVPSVLVPSEANLLLNPTHRDFSKVTIEPPQPFELDLRLLR